MTLKICGGRGGCGKLNTRIIGRAFPCNAKVKYIPQSHTTIVGYHFLSINLYCSLTLTTHETWVPSMAFMTSLKNGQYLNSFWIFDGISQNVQSWSLIFFKDSFK